jgi:hypothetical protein
MSLGTFIIIHEELLGNGNTELLLVALILLGGPGTIGLVKTITPKNPQPDTIEESSSSHTHSSS